MTNRTVTVSFDHDEWYGVFPRKVVAGDTWSDCKREVDAKEWAEYRRAEEEYGRAEEKFLTLRKALIAKYTSK